MSVPLNEDTLLEQAIPGHSALAKELRETVRRLAREDALVTVQGPLGVGKTHIAKTIHSLSRRASGPLVIAETEFVRDGDARLFFERQLNSRREPADKESALGGTLVLRNLEKSTQLFQHCLAQFLDEQAGRHTGDPLQRTIQDSTRVIVTISELGLVQRRIRYFIAVLILTVPALSERIEDVEDIVRAVARLDSLSVDITPGAVERLRAHHWQANVLSVSAMLKRATALSGGPPSGSSVVIDAAVLDRVLDRSAWANDFPPTRDELLLSRIAELESRIAVYEAESIPAHPIWEGRRFSKRQDYCFVLMPFADANDVQNVYAHHVKTVMQRCGLICERADDIHDITGIMQSVWESVNKARLVVADMTGRNSNVFYELGIAHTLGKPVIMITQTMDDVPFDLRHLRCIAYSYKPNVIKSFEDRLERTVRTILGSDLTEDDAG